MNIEEFRDYCLLKPGVTEETPFDEDTLVFKVGGKIFALTSISRYSSVNLKCDPERAIQLREEFDYVLPGYHMNKKHWNTVVIGSGVSASQLREWTDHSYELVRASLPKGRLTPRASPLDPGSLKARSPRGEGEPDDRPT